MKKILYSTVYYTISIILIVSGMSKIISPESLPSILNLTGILPEPLIVIVSILLPVVEILLGVLLAVKVQIRIVVAAAGFLFLSFLLFSIYGTIAGLNSDCGCFGDLVKSDIGWGLVVRNSIFFILVLLLYFNTAGQNVQAK